MSWVSVSVRDKKNLDEDLGDLLHIGSVSMESANQDLVFDLVQKAMAENREVDGDDGLPPCHTLF